MTTSLSLGVTVASAALSAGSTVRCGAAASRCVSHAAPTISAAAASSQRFIGIPLCDGPTGTCCGPVVAGSQEGCRALPCLGDKAPVAGTQYSSPSPGRGAMLEGGPRPTKHRVPHRPAELPGVGVLPTRVVRRDHDGPIGQLARNAVPERWPMPRREPLPPPRRLEPALVRNAAQ